MSAVLAIDQGTSGTKAIVVDSDDGILACVEVPLHPRYLPGGGVEQDPDALLASVLDAGRAAVRTADRPLAAVALANQGETVLAWDPVTGTAASPAIGWQDRRAESICAELADERDGIVARTGLVLDPYFSAPKLAWLRREVTTDGVVTTTDTWLVHHLTGEFVTDISTASRSLITDLDTGRWDGDLLELFGLAGERLPRIVACDEPVGTTTAFGPPLAVTGLIVDQQAALLAQSCHRAGEAKCTFGTGAFLLANTGGHAPRSGAGLTTSVAWRMRDTTSWCVDGQVYTAGSAVRWLQQLGFLGDASELDARAAADSGGVVCVPALAGLGAPWWRPNATATLTGMTLSTRPEHVITAVLQGIAAQVAELADLVAVDAGHPLAALRVDGGLTRSRVLMQATADLTGLSVEVYPSPHATALGAAAVGRLGADPSLSVADAAPSWSASARFDPVMTAADRADLRSRWRATADRKDTA